MPNETVLFFENPMVLIGKGEKARGDSALLEDVEGGKTFATRGCQLGVLDERRKE